MQKTEPALRSLNLRREASFATLSFKFFLGKVCFGKGADEVSKNLKTKISDFVCMNKEPLMCADAIFSVLAVGCGLCYSKGSFKISKITKIASPDSQDSLLAKTTLCFYPNLTVWLLRGFGETSVPKVVFSSLQKPSTGVMLKRSEHPQQARVQHSTASNVNRSSSVSSVNPKIDKDAKHLQKGQGNIVPNQDPQPHDNGGEQPPQLQTITVPANAYAQIEAFLGGNNARHFINERNRPVNLNFNQVRAAVERSALLGRSDPVISRLVQALKLGALPRAQVIKVFQALLQGQLQIQSFLSPDKTLLCRQFLRDAWFIAFCQ